MLCTYTTNIKVWIWEQIMGIFFKKRRENMENGPPTPFLSQNKILNVDYCTKENVKNLAILSYTKHVFVNNIELNTFLL
jgi:hypothetical protein